MNGSGKAPPAIPRLPLHRLGRASPQTLGFIEHASTPSSARHASFLSVGLGHMTHPPPPRNGDDPDLTRFLAAQKELTEKQTQYDSLMKEAAALARQVDSAKIVIFLTSPFFYCRPTQNNIIAAPAHFIFFVGSEQGLEMLTYMTTLKTPNCIPKRRDWIFWIPPPPDTRTH